MKVQLLFVAGFLSLLSTVSAINWQGYGNVSADNLTAIWSFINSNIQNAVATNALAKFSTDFSDRLNYLWDPAWNIITIDSPVQKDSVLYGYAFRNHWMWYNGYTVGNKVLTFIIWKDYNCHSWQSIGPGTPVGLDGNQMSDLVTSGSSAYSQFKSDVWKLAKQFMTNVQAKNSYKGSNKAYSLVMSEGTMTDTNYYARVCLYQNKQAYGVIDMNTFQGRFLFFQTRLDS